MSPQPDPCACLAEIVSQGLVAEEWPACLATHTFTLSAPVKGRCDHGNDCPGAGEEAKACRFSFAYSVAGNCVGMAIEFYERDAGSSDAWTDLGIDIALAPTSAGNVTIRPPCGKERKVAFRFLSETIWEGIARCNDCVSAGGGASVATVGADDVKGELILPSSEFVTKANEGGIEDAEGEG